MAWAPPEATQEAEAWTPPEAQESWTPPEAAELPYPEVKGSIYGTETPTPDEAATAQLNRLIDDVTRSPVAGMIPRPQGENIGAGIVRSLASTAESVPTPLNIGLAGAAMIGGPVAAKGIVAGFGAHMLKSVPEQTSEVLAAYKEGKLGTAAELATTGVTNLLLGGLSVPVFGKRPRAGGLLPGETPKETARVGSEDIAADVIKTAVDTDVAKILSEPVEKTAAETIIPPETPLPGAPPEAKPTAVNQFQGLRPALIDADGKLVTGEKGTDHYTISGQLSPDGQEAIGYGKSGASKETVKANFDRRGWVDDDGVYVSLRDLQAASGDAQKALAGKKSQGPGAAAATEPLAVKQESIPKGLRSDPDVVRLLEGEPVEPKIKAPTPSEEGGFIFGEPMPKVIPKGATPRGDTEFLRIPTALKRVFHGLEREGSADVIGRTNNKAGQVLSKAIKRHVDTEQELFGQMYSKFEESLKGLNQIRQEKAFSELQQYFADKENGRPVPAISPEAQRILKSWEDIADQTGTIATAHNVQVFDPKVGGHRPMHKIGREYFPRVFRPEVQRVMRDPDTNPELFNALVDAVATHKGIATDAAANYLRGEAGRFQANDFLGNLEMARSEQLPEIFYDYDLRQVAARYIPSFSERMAQIIAYGQRLGPRDAPSKQNLWDIARGEAGDSYSQQWIRAAEDQAVNLRPNSASSRIAVRAQTLANALLLSNPVTTVPRNFLSGIAATSEVLGVVRSAKPLVEMVTNAQSRMDARQIGAVRDRMADFLHADQLGESFIDDAVRVVTSKALKYSGYNGSEVFVRAHGSLTAQQFATDAVAAINKNPTSYRSREALALFKRMGVDAKEVVKEDADWKTGDETRKFIRTVIRDTQGGYRFDQVPLWANSPVGRFFYQFGRYGVQRSRNIWKNAVKPALGEEVEWNGKTMSVYNPRPLLKMGAGVIVLGEVFAGIASVAFDRDRKDASLKEIRETLQEDTKAGIGLAAERAINDIIMAGTLGIWSQPIDFAKQLKDQSRFKNPAEPPSLASVRALIELTNNAVDQGGKLTSQDMIRFGGSFAPGVKQVTDVARNIFDEPLYEAQNDVRTLRTAGMRWAKTAGMDAAKMAGKFRKSGNAPAYEAIQQALLVGNADLARMKSREFVASQKDKGKATKAVRSSVQSRQPFRVGPYTSAEHRTDFMKWAEQHLPKDDYRQAKRVQERYERAAREAGLMN